MQTIALRNTAFRDLGLVLLASFLICLSGSIAFPLWFTPVPIVTQNAVVLLMALLLGPKRGSLAVFAFLMQGSLGLPVFSNGGAGLLHLIGPKGGYLFGYLIAAFVTGWISQRDQTFGGAVKALLAGNSLIYLLGASYLSLFVGLDQAFALGVAPFLIGDFLKGAITLKIVQSLKEKNVPS